MLEMSDSVRDGWVRLRPVIASWAHGGECNPKLQFVFDRWNAGEHLDFEEAQAAFDELLNPTTSDAQIGEFLIRSRTENLIPDEIAGFARALRKRAPHVRTTAMPGIGLIGDTCGTGGDTIPTFNVSTTVMFVLAASEMSIAKHGNRAFTSRCGSADVLQHLGIAINLKREDVEECLKTIHLAFMFAPIFHEATSRVQGVRKRLADDARVREILADQMPANLKQKTVFNVLGPLSNPADAGVQLIGVYSESLLDPIAKVLLRLGVKRAAVVHGRCNAPGFGGRGLDEVSTLGPTRVVEVRDGEILSHDVDPEEHFGLRTATPSEIEGGDIECNAAILEGILKNEIKGAKLDLVLANAAVGLYLHEQPNEWLPRCARRFVERARELIESGKAFRKLEELRSLTQELAARSSGA